VYKRQARRGAGQQLEPGAAGRESRKHGAPAGGPMTLSDEIIEAANAISTSLDAAVFVYSGSIDDKGLGLLVGAMKASGEQPVRQNSILFLTTYGGNASEAYRIARLLQTITHKFYLCIPSTCKSAGTLIALGAAEIFMPVASELGPLDVQLWRRDEIGQRRSGMVVRTALEILAEETFNVFEQAMLRITLSSRHNIGFEVASRVAAMIATGVMTPVYQQVNPESLGNDLRDLSIATAYGERLIEHGGNATEDTVRRLVEGYPSHDFIIDREEARKLFKKVNDTTDAMDAMIRGLDEVAYLVQDPHIIFRADRNPVEEETSSHDSASSETTAEADGDAADTANHRADLDQGCRAARRSNRQEQRKAESSA